MVSVVIPAYRSAGTIGRAVDSVLNQTVPVAQILVVDDGSPDRLERAIAAYGDRVTLIRKLNGGAASARNLGIDHATAEWIAFLDGDDYWHPLKIERQLAVLKTHPELQIIGARWHSVPAEDACPVSPDQALPSPGPANRWVGGVLNLHGVEAFDAAMFLWTSTTMVRRDLLSRFRFVPGFEPAEDRHLWVRLISNAPAYLLPDVLAVYTQSSSSLSNSNVDRDCGNMLRVILDNADLLGKVALREKEIALYRRWAASHVFNGSPRAAISPAMKRLRMQPWSVNAWLVLAKLVFLTLR